MRVLVQRVSKAAVEVDGKRIAEIGPGLLLFVGVGREDISADPRKNAPSRGGSLLAKEMAAKLANLRIFPDAEGKSNLSLLDTAGSALVISQFTLYADYRRGRRPSFSEAADPDKAETLVEEFCQALRDLGVPTATGHFGARMVVSLVNDGPYTILIDSEVLRQPRRGGRAAGAPPAPSLPGSSHSPSQS